jgi:hypothetical protein
MILKRHWLLAAPSGSATAQSLLPASRSLRMRNSEKDKKDAKFYVSVLVASRTQNTFHMIYSTAKIE